MFKERIDSHPDEIYNIMLSCEKKNRIYIQGSAFLKVKKFESNLSRLISFLIS